MKLKRLCISCGGTGGHFYPGLAVARIFKEQGGEVLLILGGKHADEQIKTAEKFGIPARKIAASPLSARPGGALKFFRDTLKGTLECRRIYRHFFPEALLAMGSFASFPPILAAKWKRVPLFLHDGNAKLGKTNRRLSRLASGMALSFPTKDETNCKCPPVLTGMPLRPELIRGKMTKDAAIAELNQRWQCQFSADIPTILIFGGSLGAASINDNCRIPLYYQEKEVQVIHLSGAGKAEELKEYYKEASFNHLILESAQDMQIFYSAADWIVCRAGGSTVSEVACFGKYATLIPYPFAAQDHQTDNALYLTPSGGAELIPDKDLAAGLFADRLRDFLADPALYQKKGEQLLALAFPDAAERVLNMIDSIVYPQE